MVFIQRRFWLFLLVFLVGGAALYAFARHETREVPLIHIDGAFQNASTLFRLQNGHLPGRDFFPYLGLGPVFVSYPLFSAHGGHLIASQITAYLLAGIALWVPLFCIFRWTGAARTAAGALLASGLVLAVGMLIVLRTEPTDREHWWYHVVRWVEMRVLPLASSRGLRALVVWLTMLGLAALWKYSTHAPWKRLVGISLLAGVAVFWANDFGPPAALVAGLAALGHAARERRVWSFMPISGLVFLAAALGVVTLATGGHAAELMEFNFKDVATDQWWYFGSYDDAHRIYSLRDLPKLFGSFVWVDTLVLLGVGWLAWKRRSARLTLLTGAGIALFLGGAIPSLGGHVMLYFAQLRTWTVFVVLGLGIAEWRQRSGRHFVGWGRHVLPGVGLAALAGVAVVCWREAAALDLKLSRGKSRLYVPELGGYCKKKDWEPVFAEERARGYRPIIEEYYGLIQAFHHEPGMAKVDAVIHALGSQRQQWSRELETKAERVGTSRNDVFPVSFSRWVQWSMQQNWWFYRKVLTQFKMMRQTPTMYLWERRQAPMPWTPVACEIHAQDASGMQRVSIAGPAQALREVTLHFRAVTQGRHLILVRRHPSDPANIASTISLSDDGTASFPIWGMAGETQDIYICLTPARAGALELLSATAQAPAEDPLPKPIIRPLLQRETTDG